MKQITYDEAFCAVCGLPKIGETEGDDQCFHCRHFPHVRESRKVPGRFPTTTFAIAFAVWMIWLLFTAAC